MNTFIDVQFLLLANTLGQSILVETLKSAAYYVSNSNCHTTERMKIARIREGSSCFVFVQGSGLETLIQRYGMDYDAEKIREGFNYCLRQNIHPLV